MIKDFGAANQFLERDNNETCQTIHGLEFEEEILDDSKNLLVR
jgi:hypothetical protein